MKFSESWMNHSKIARFFIIRKGGELMDKIINFFDDVFAFFVGIFFRSSLAADWDYLREVRVITRSYRSNR